MLNRTALACFMALCILPIAEHLLREDFVKSYMPKHSSSLPLVTVSHSNVFNDTINLYTNSPEAVHQFPLKVNFRGEQAIDAAGVGRDLFSAFWDSTCMHQAMFEGCSIVVPSLHAQTDMQSLPVLGISHRNPCWKLFVTTSDLLIVPLSKRHPELKENFQSGSCHKAAWNFIPIWLPSRSIPSHPARRVASGRKSRVCKSTICCYHTYEQRNPPGTRIVLAG